MQSNPWIFIKWILLRKPTAGILRKAPERKTENIDPNHQFLGFQPLIFDGVATQNFSASPISAFVSLCVCAYVTIIYYWLYIYTVGLHVLLIVQTQTRTIHSFLNRSGCLYWIAIKILSIISWAIFCCTPQLLKRSHGTGKNPTTGENQGFRCLTKRGVHVKCEGYKCVAPPKTSYK